MTTGARSGSAGPAALVTGAAGYLGVAVVRRLVAAGWEAHALIRPGGDTSRIAGILAPARVHPVPAAPSAIADLVEAIRPAAIFHLAAAGRLTHRRDEVASMVEANLALAVGLAEAAAAISARLVGAGSYWEYGDRGEGPPNSLYAATKRALDPIQAYYTGIRGLRWMKLALQDVYGPGDWRNRLVTQLVAAALDGTPLDLTDGRQEIEPVHVEDAAAAFLHAADRLSDDATHPPVVGLDRGERLTVRALALLVEEMTGRRIDARWGVRPYPPGQIFSPARLPPLAGWGRRYRLREGLASVIASLQARPPESRQSS
jgi:nucleoside-diphosphate-sugar epimerase